MSDGDIIWACSRWFLCCLQLISFATKDADAKSAHIGSAKSVYSAGAYASNTYVRSTYVGNAFSAISACIKSAYPAGIV